jgi:amidase
MAASVADLALLFAVLAGRPVPFVDGPLRGARIGIWVPDGAPDGPAAVLDAAAETLRERGVHVVPVQPALDHLPPKQDDLLLAGFRRDLDDYLATAPGAAVRSLAELVQFNRDDPIELLHFGQEHFERAAALPHPDPASLALHRTMRRAAARAVLDRPLGQHDLDAILTLSNGPAPLIDYATGDGAEILTTTPAAVAGYPMVTLPAGVVDGLPVGVTFVGPAGADERLLALAGAFERVRTGTPRNVSSTAERTTSHRSPVWA